MLQLNGGEPELGMPDEELTPLPEAIDDHGGSYRSGSPATTGRAPTRTVSTERARRARPRIRAGRP
ncbi:hypothetical protein [Streptomyces anandii]|uniref:hypothetical protein n=1 Tax=Streptomyces anandii TaxID=285454 RepID=UPI00379B5220